MIWELENILVSAQIIQMVNNMTKQKPILFIHCANGSSGKCSSIMQEFFDSIDKSGCKEFIDVKIFSVGKETIDKTPFGIEGHCFDYGMGEFYTLGNLKKYCNLTDNNIPVGYIQTKGEFNNTDNPAIIDWRKYMTYFVVENMSTCIDSIKEGYDAVGVDWHVVPNRHFSGNFWWSSSSYIKSLPEINPPKFSLFKNTGKNEWIVDKGIDGSLQDRHLAEFWVGVNDPKVKCLHSSEIDVYNRHNVRYEEIKYRKNIL